MYSGATAEAESLGAAFDCATTCENAAHGCRPRVRELFETQVTIQEKRCV